MWFAIILLFGAAVALWVFSEHPFDSESKKRERAITALKVAATQKHLPSQAIFVATALGKKVFGTYTVYTYNDTAVTIKASVDHETGTARVEISENETARLVLDATVLGEAVSFSRVPTIAAYIPGAWENRLTALKPSAEAATVEGTRRVNAEQVKEQTDKWGLE